jgi:hypothetical protein
MSKPMVMGGRKSEEEQLLVCRIHTRVTQKKYDELTAMLDNARGIRSHSELLRDILENKKIVVQLHDASLDKVMEELSGIRKELQAIGININQVTHKFHIEDLAEGKLFQALEIVKLYQQTDLKVTHLFEVIAKLSEQWLPK